MNNAVQVGQIWADNDKRFNTGRKVRVDKIYDSGRAKCWSYYNNEALGRYVWIRVDRFKPNSTGYRLIQDSGAAT